MTLADIAAEMAREQLLRGERCCFTARGASMKPFLLDGDRLEVAPAKAIRLGDVVLVDIGSFGVAHRVVWKLGARFILKGDALPWPDGIFHQSSVLGVVVEGLRDGVSLRICRPEAVPFSLAGGVLRVAGLPRVWRKMRHLLGR